MKLPFRRRRDSGLRLPGNRPLHQAQPLRPHRPVAPPVEPAIPVPGTPPADQPYRDEPSVEEPRFDEPALDALPNAPPRRIAADAEPADAEPDAADPRAAVPAQAAAASPAPVAAPPPSDPGPQPRLLDRVVAALPRALPQALPQDLSESLGRRVAATGLTPNMLTVIGLLGSGGAAALAAYGHFWQAGLVMLAAAAFDLLDGAVARATGRATTWGAIFDAVSDRLGEFAMYLGLLVWFSAPAHFDRDAVILIGVATGGAMLVSYTRSKAGEYGVRIREGVGTRFERIVILAIGLFAGEVVAVLWILAVLTNLTALQRWGLTWWALREHAESARGAAGSDSAPSDDGAGPG